MRGHPLVIGLICLLGAGCARHYVQIGEGLSSPTRAEGIRVAPRMFTVRQILDLCREVVPVSRLVIVPSTLELSQGNVYELSTLTVVAVNDADVAMPNVPIVLEAEDNNVLRLTSNDPDVDQGRVRAVAPGRFRLRVRATCSNEADAVVEGMVR